MHALELKLPPAALALLIALAMWGASRMTPSLEVPFLARGLAGAVFVAVGMGIAVAGIVTFRRAGTTIDPTKPGSASVLVSSGVYRFTRNPMYLGVLLALIGWAAFLSNAWALVGVPAFVLYMNRFQITPEERTLSAIFGAEYSAYKSMVRRWL